MASENTVHGASTLINGAKPLRLPTSVTHSLTLSSKTKLGRLVNLSSNVNLFKKQKKTVKLLEENREHWWL